MKNLPLLLLPISLLILGSAGISASFAQTSAGRTIKKIDFKNFTYPWFSESKQQSDAFTLRNGKLPLSSAQNGASLGRVEYGDVTRDGREEAVLYIDEVSEGSGDFSIVYVYTLENDAPKLLWGFESGDRADGGFKNIYTKNGELIIELYGDARYVNGEWESTIPTEGFKGLCCPVKYSRVHFRWDGAGFVMHGERELLDVAKPAGRKG
jgi:hypothetical protein